MKSEKQKCLEEGTHMIKYSIRGENLEVTEAIRDYVVSKLEKIEKYFQAEQELDARVNLKVYREKTAKVEVTIPLGSITLRAEDVSQDMYGSIDLVTDKIDVRFVKIKQKSSVKIKIRWQLVNYLQMLWWKIQMLSSLELFVQNKLI